MNEEWQKTFDDLLEAGLIPNSGGTLLKLYDQPVQAMVLYRPGKSSHPVHIQPSRETYRLDIFEKLSPYLVRSRAKRDVRGWDFYDVGNWTAFKNTILSDSMPPTAQRKTIRNVSDAVRRMAAMALNTTQNSNGQTVLKVVKNKNMGFASREELEDYIAELVERQCGRCAITGVLLPVDDVSTDLDLLASLDRIDSSRHYESGNLQVVCRFINQWKSDSDNANFKRLIGIIKNREDGQ
jgi:hypothetical protein